jgi:hypothetical protein
MVGCAVLSDPEWLAQGDQSRVSRLPRLGVGQVVVIDVEADDVDCGGAGVKASRVEERSAEVAVC